MKKKILWIAAILLVLAIAGGVLGYHYWYQNAHVFVEEAVYEKELTTLDLRGTGVSLEHYESVRQQLPDCEIRYDLPFQGSFYPDDTRELTITSLTEEEIGLLDYLPKLETVHAEGCQDYAQLMLLQQRRPECKVLYNVTILGESYDQDTRALAFGENEPDMQELTQALAWLPDMETIHFDQPTVVQPEELLALREAFSAIDITWEKEAFGTVYDQDVTEIDLSDMEDLSLEEVKQVMAYFPELEKLVMCDCGFDDETMAAFREEVREDYKVVWALYIYSLRVRTDDPYFFPNRYSGLKISNYQVQKLRYCEDMICVDLGHRPITDLSFLEGMPHLKYFICIDSPLMYIDPISNCKELIYCELFWTQINDFTPLLGCTALQDLNVARTNGDPMVFKDMPWLKNLWLDGFDIRPSKREILNEALPNTYIKYCDAEMTANGWRDLQNYFDMRELLGMPANTW